MSKKPCFFCGKESDYWPTSFHENNTYYHIPMYSCAGCGRYVVDERFDIDSNPPSDDRRFRLACLMQEHHRRGENGLFGVFEDDFKPGENTIDRHLDRWWRVNELLQEFPRAADITDRALLNLSREFKHPMDNITIKPKDLEFMFFCPGQSVYRMYGCLKDMGLLIPQVNTIEGLELSISPAGWQRIKQIAEVPRDSQQAFVAMWFDPTMDIFCKEGIEPGVKDAGYDAKRIDNKEHNNKIDDEIVAEIRKSRFVVADFTAGFCQECNSCEHGKECKEKVRPRGGVYFEAGFALGLGIPVIWTVRSDQIEQVHFDTRQYNYIVYETAQDLRTRLCNRIRATIGQGKASPG